MRCSRLTELQSGVALVVVLWFLVLLTIMAASFALTMRRESAMVRNAKEEAISGALADGGLYYAMIMLSHSNSEKKWKADGTVYDVAFGGGQIRVEVYDEAGKFDLNKTEGPVLQNLFSSVGLVDDQAQSLADAILDWRDTDGLTHLQGAEEDEYRDAGRDYGPRNKPFQSLEELRKVLGMTYQIYSKVESLLTIYSGEKGIDPGTGSKQALLGLPGVDEQLVEEFIELRSQTQNTGELAEKFRGIQGVGSGGKKNQVFDVHVQARTSHGPVAAVSAILKKGPGSFGEPFTILRWRRYLVGKNSLFSEQKIDSDADENK